LIFGNNNQTDKSRLVLFYRVALVIVLSVNVLDLVVFVNGWTTDQMAPYNRKITRRCKKNTELNCQTKHFVTTTIWQQKVYVQYRFIVFVYRLKTSFTWKFRIVVFLFTKNYHLPYAITTFWERKKWRTSGVNIH